MIDPGGWAEHLGAVWAGMMTSRERHDMTIGVFLKRWGHLSVTVTIIIFAFQQYQVAQSVRNDMQTQLTLATERIATLRESNETQDRERETAIRSLLYRLDAQRDDIRKLQQQMLDHVTQDERRARGR